MNAAAAAVTAAAVLAAGLAEIPPSRGRGMRWWRLRARTPEVDPKRAARALAGVLRRFRSSQVTVVRRGSQKAVSDLWLGLRGPRRPEAAAKALADAAGCSLGEEGRPPPAPAGRWWESVPLPSQELSPEEKHRRSPTRQTAALSPEAYDDDRVAEFPVYADGFLDGGGVWAVTAAPLRDNRHVRAVVMTTSHELAHSWTDACALRVRRVTGGVFASAALALGVVCLTAGSGLAGPWMDGALGLGGPLRAAPVAAGVLAAGVAGWRMIRPRKAEQMRLGWYLPLRWWQARRVGVLPASHFAGWANMGERAAVSAPQMTAPAPVTEPDGPAALVGHDPQGSTCWLPEADRHSGVFALGDPGTGKTTFLLGLLKADAAARASGDNKSGVWIETKGEGAARAAGVIRAAGVDPVVLRADTRTGGRLELVDWGNPSRAAHLLTEAVRYAFEFDDIRESSAEILNAVFAAVTAAPVEAAEQWGYPEGRPNVVKVAYRLLGGEAAAGWPERARKTLEACGGPAAGLFLSYLPPHKSRRDSQMLLEPPRNKMQALLPAAGLFEASGRRWVDLPRLITGRAFAVLDLSPTAAGGEYTELTAKRTAAMCLFVCWDAIKRHCDNWQQQGRSVSVYSDELSDIAGLGDARGEVVQQIADQGRSRGVWPTFATQRPGQIPPSTREAVMSFGSRVFFRLEHVETAEHVAADLDGVYTVSEIRSFGVGRCAARLRCGGAAQPAFTLRPQNL